MEEIKKCMRQVKTIIPSGCGVMDTTGRILAATDEGSEDQTDPSFRAVMSSDNLFASTADRTYLKVFIGEQLKYIIYIENTDQDAKINLQLIAEWLKTLVKEKGTDAEKAIFDAACSSYQFPLGTPQTFGKRTTDDSIDYEFKVKSQGFGGGTSTSTIYVTMGKEAGAKSEFTRVVR